MEVTLSELFSQIADELRVKLETTGKITASDFPSKIADIKMLDTTDATATAEDIMLDKTAYVNGEKLVGTNKGNNLTKDTPIEMDNVSGNVKIQIIRKNLFNINGFTRIEGYNAEYSVIPSGMRVTLWNETPHTPIKLLAINLSNYKGKSLTFSAYAKSSGENKAMLLMCFCNSSGLNRSGVIYSEETTDGQLSVTIQIPSTLTDDTTYLCLMLYGRRESDGSGAGAYVDYTNIQLEVGDKMTKYTPYMGDNQTFTSSGIAEGDKVIISLI